jgi:hypothetical protein
MYGAFIASTGNVSEDKRIRVDASEKGKLAGRRRRKVYGFPS